MIIIQNLVRIDKDRDEPVYLQIANGIAGIIQQGILKPGTALPSSRKLAEMYDIHRKTVTAAFDELQAMGWAESLPRKGFFVASELPVVKPRAVSAARAAAAGLSRGAGPGTGIVGAVAALGRPGIGYPSATAFAIENRPYGYDQPFVARRERLAFNDGFPDTRLAPVELLVREYRRFSNYRFTAKFLSYGPAQGSENLRNEMARFLNVTRGLSIGPENILITKGVQLAIYLVSRLLLKKGDEVIVSEPGWTGTSEVFRAAGASLNFVGVDDDGMDIDAVERICRVKKVRMVFVIPHHHMPTTTTLCAARRQKLLELARRYEFAVLEDDYDFDFQYSSSPILPLASVDTSGHVIYVGSFCKIIAPAIRIGFLVAPVNLIAQATRLRKMVDRQGEQLMEEAMANLLRNGDIDRHLKKAGKIYHERRDRLSGLLASELSGRVEFREPDGGFAAWVRFVGDRPVREISVAASRLGLAMSDGEDYWHVKPPRVNGVRLGFASLNEKEMEEAVGILRRVVG
ncbi:MAG TPA: PLP-dependent aminotransferase family protein [Puia sp.]|nr:PLP-dependent aminotransferase family protein [Puia sp.]